MLKKKLPPIENWLFLICKIFNSLHPRMLWTKSAWNWSSGSGEEEFQMWSMYFCYVVIIGHGPFNPIHPRMLCAKFGWNWPMKVYRQVKGLMTGFQLRWANNRTFNSGKLKILVKIFKMEQPGGQVQSGMKHGSNSYDQFLVSIMFGLILPLGQGIHSSSSPSLLHRRNMWSTMKNEQVITTCNCK